MGRGAKSTNGRINWIVSNGRLSEYGPRSPKFMLSGRSTLVLLHVLEGGGKATSVDGSTTWELSQDGCLRESSPAIEEIVLSEEDTLTLTELLVAEREAIAVAAEIEERLRSDNNRELFVDDEEEEEENDGDEDGEIL